MRSLAGVVADIDAATLSPTGLAKLRAIDPKTLPLVDQPGWVERVTALYHEVNAAAIRLSGTVSGEHGDGRLRAPLLDA